LGLDTYACIRNGDKFKLMDEDLFVPNYLVGGIMSNMGNSFRGKVYNDYITYVTGFSLYQETIDEEDVKTMANKLAIASERMFVIEPGFESRNIYGIDKQTAKELAEWFGIVAKNNGVVCGWW
jgi:hypothetical protein